MLMTLVVLAVLEIALAFGKITAEIPMRPILTVVFDTVGRVTTGAGTFSGIALLATSILGVVGELTAGVGTASGIALFATSVLDDIVGVGFLTGGLVPVAAPGTTVGGEVVGGPKTTFDVLL